MIRNACSGLCASSLSGGYGAGSGCPGTIQVALDGNVGIAASQVRQGLQETIAEESEQVVTDAGIRSRHLGELALK